MARSGEVCALLVPGPHDETWPPVLDPFERALGGRRVLPLHVTLERFDPQGRTAALLEVIRLIRGRLHPVSIKATGELLPFRSEFRGENVLKLAISATDALRHDRAVIREAIWSTGLVSAYSDEHWWTVTVLEGIEGSRSVPPHEGLVRADLFTAQHLVLSRIESPGDYTILYETDLTEP